MEDRSLKRFINKVSVFRSGWAMLFTLLKLLASEPRIERKNSHSIEEKFIR